jgi:serine/threonine-protein phosphatase 5
MEEYERELQRILFSKAIKKEGFDLESECIDKIEVSSTYTGPRIVNGCIDMALVAELIDWFKSDNKLHSKYVYEIMLQAKQVFEKESSMVNIDLEAGQTLTICGDIHGQFFDLLKIFEMNGMPSEQHVYVLLFIPFMFLAIQWRFC